MSSRDQSPHDEEKKDGAIKPTTKIENADNETSNSKSTKKLYDGGQELNRIMDHI